MIVAVVAIVVFALMGIAGVWMKVTGHGHDNPNGWHPLRRKD